MVAKQGELHRNHTENDLAIANARLRAVNEINCVDDVLQTVESLTHRP